MARPKIAVRRCALPPPSCRAAVSIALLILSSLDTRPRKRPLPKSFPDRPIHALPSSTIAMQFSTVLSLLVLAVTSAQAMPVYVGMMPPLSFKGEAAAVIDRR